MVIVQVCIGSSCHLKGSQQIVEKFQTAVEVNGLSDEVVLSGSFCTGKCNREGVTVTVDDDVFTGVTPESFPVFFRDNILPRVGKGV